MLYFPIGFKIQFNTKNMFHTTTSFSHWVYITGLSTSRYFLLAVFSCFWIIAVGFCWTLYPFLQVALRELLQNYGDWIFIGSSFGGFVLADYFRENNVSTTNTKLILVSPAGLLPTLRQDYGKFWSMIFAFGLPSRFVRMVAEPFNLICFWMVFLFEKNRLEQKKLFWRFAQMSCRDNVSAAICAKFITFSFFDSRWNYPLFAKLLNKNLNIGIIWGIDDTVVPAHGGKLLVDMSLKTEENPFEMCIVSGGGHSPVSFNNGEDFMVALDYLTRKKTEQQQTPTERFEMERLDEIITSSKGSVFCELFTERHVDAFYNKISEWVYKKEPYKKKDVCVVVDLFIDIKKHVDAYVLMHDEVEARLKTKM